MCHHNTAGPDNTATGFQALLNNTAGGSNVALGVDALSGNTTGSFNIAVGTQALGSINNTAGSGNIAIGDHPGFNVRTSNNIHIGHNGDPSGTDSALIRIGLSPFQTRTFIAGIRDATVVGGIQMFINNQGQLGTNPSATRFKEGIEPVGEDGRRLLALRPVRFRYKPAYDDPTRPLQYGLVAEEVAEVFPELVHPDSDGTPYSVRYHLLSVLLLNELQRQERERQEEKAQTAIRFDAQQERLAEQDARLAAQQRELDELRAQAWLIDELTARLSRLEAKGAAAGR